MPKNINSAYRLVSLLKSIPGYPDNIQTLDVWAKLFRVDQENLHKRAAVISDRLNLMNRELDVVRSQMQKLEFSDFLYEPSISRVENAISTMLLPVSWNQARQHLTSETILALAFCSEILDDEEEQVSPEEISIIREQVDELRILLADSELPQRLQTLIRHHIELILTALDEYPVVGAKVFREVAHTALGEMIDAKDSISENSGHEEIGKLRGIWDKVNKTADVALKAEKVAQLTQNVWSILEPLI